MNQKGLPRQLQAILHVLGFEWGSLFDGGDSAGGRREKVVAWLYRILDTLDSKTGHLLRFASLLLAAQTFLAGILVRDQPRPPLGIEILALALLFFPLGTAVSALSIFQVRWPFFGHLQVDMGNGEQAKIHEQIKQEMIKLGEVCDRRVKANERTYRWCWISAMSFFVTLILSFVAISTR